MFPKLLNIKKSKIFRIKKFVVYIKVKWSKAASKKKLGFIIIYLKRILFLKFANPLSDEGPTYKHPNNKQTLNLN